MRTILLPITSTRKNNISTLLFFKRIALIILIVVLIIYIVFEVLESESDYKFLAKHGNLVIATITKKEERLSRNKTVYDYSFDVDSKTFTNMVQYDYEWYDLEFNMGDSIYVLYSIANPEINRDYRYLKQGAYDVDSAKYEREMKKIGFREHPFPSGNGYTRTPLF